MASVNESVKIKSIVLTTTGSGSDYSNLQVKEEDYPKIERDDQVIVRIKAAGLNFAELMQRQGLYKPSTKTPYTPGYEGSGIVEVVGSAIADLKVNDRVIVFNSSNIWKEVVILPRINVTKMPDEMSFEDGAGLVVNYVTAYQMLFRMAHVKPGDSILIHMAAGGVGTAASQLCKTQPGVTVFGTASEGKHDAIREYGVDYPIDYTKVDYVEEIKKISPEGVDIVLDPLNGENAIKGYSLLKPLGRIVHFGAASMTGENRSLVSAFKTWWKCLTVNSLDLMSDNKMTGGYHLGILALNPSFIKIIMSDINTLLELYKQKKIRIKIDSTFSYSKIGEAMKRMHSRQNIGKIILKPDSEFPIPVTPEEVKIVTTVITTTQTNLSESSKVSITTPDTTVVLTQKPSGSIVSDVVNKVIEDAKTAVDSSKKPEPTLEEKVSEEFLIEQEACLPIRSEEVSSTTNDDNNIVQATT